MAKRTEEQHTPDCGCYSKHDGDIIYCPMHLAAPAMLTALELSQEALVWTSASEDFAPGGIRRTGWELLAVSAMDAGRAALAQARPSVAGQIPEAGK